MGPGAAMDAALGRLNRAEEDVAALREAIKVSQTPQQWSKLYAQVGIVLHNAKL